MTVIGGDLQARRDENAEADGHNLHRERGHARHLRTGRRQLQGLLRAGRQATPQRIRLEIREWQHPPGLGAAERLDRDQAEADHWLCSIIESAHSLR